MFITDYFQLWFLYRKDRRISAGGKQESSELNGFQSGNTTLSFTLLIRLWIK